MEDALPASLGGWSDLGLVWGAGLGVSGSNSFYLKTIPYIPRILLTHVGLVLGYELYYLNKYAERWASVNGP